MPNHFSIFVCANDEYREKKGKEVYEGKTLKEVSMFVSTKLSTLEAVAGTATHFVLKKYKDHGMILIDKEPANRMKVTP